MKETKIQRDIEDAVTDGRGYERTDRITIPYEYRDKEIGLQIALRSMNVLDKGEYGVGDFLNEHTFKSRVNHMAKRFNEAGISLYSITDANGFREAMGYGFLNVELDLEKELKKVHDSENYNFLIKKDEEKKVYILEVFLINKNKRNLIFLPDVINMGQDFSKEIKKMLEENKK